MNIENLEAVQQLVDKLKRQRSLRKAINRRVSCVHGTDECNRRVDVIYKDGSGVLKLSEKSRDIIKVIVLQDIDEQIRATEQALIDLGADLD